MTKTYENHIKDLEEKISSIYTVETSDELKGAGSKEKINILDELEACNALEQIYSVIEKEGVREGEIFTNYNKYLTSVRKHLTILNKLKEEVERNHLSDLTNSKLLLHEFKEYLNVIKLNNDRK